MLLAYNATNKRKKSLPERIKAQERMNRPNKTGKTGKLITPCSAT